MGLVLSLFPGIGLLDMAFEEEGFTVVQARDRLVWVLASDEMVMGQSGAIRSAAG